MAGANVFEAGAVGSGPGTQEFAVCLLQVPFGIEPDFQDMQLVLLEFAACLWHVPVTLNLAPSRAAAPTRVWWSLVAGAVGLVPDSQYI